MRKVLFFAACLFSYVGLAEEAIIINASSCPLQITSYRAFFQEDGKYKREGIKHQVALENNVQQAVLAYEVTFTSFDIFNEHMGRNLGGIAIETIQTGDTASGSWLQSPYAPFKFKNYGIGVAYINKVRLADGNIWTYDKGYVLGELKKVEDSLTEDVFESEEGK